MIDKRSSPIAGIVRTVETKLSTARGQELYRRAKQLIPGGTQLLSKRPEMFLPDQWPSYFSKAKGVEVTDIDGNTYVDMSMMAIGACVLGYADPDVDAAVKAAIDAGSASTLNAPEEVELAELLCELHPWAGMVRYARSGGEAMMLAVRIARAWSRRDKIAFSGYHGWCDWYLAANLADEDALDGQLMPGLDPAGVPRGLKGTALPFHYNRLDQLKAIVDANRGEIGAIVMEPQRGHAPDPGFLESVREIATDIGAALIFDEVTTGFRMTDGGIHTLLGVNPDLAVFAKSMANGYAMAAIIGTVPVMEAAQATFISSTNWTERIGTVAALATIRKFRRERVAEHLKTIGNLTFDGWKRAAAKTGLKVHTEGLPSLTHFGFEHPDEPTLTTLFTQDMLERGYLAYSQFKPSFAHQPSHIDAYMRAVDASFAMIAGAIRAGDYEARLKGPRARRGFYRLTS
jgi:glutamate-1-semialdehyde 2,1-aminomutase